MKAMTSKAGKKNMNVVVYEDGKKGRGVKGTIISKSEKSIVINLKQWGYGDDEPHKNYTFHKDVKLWEEGTIYKGYYCEEINHFYNEEEQTKDFFDETIQWINKKYFTELYEEVSEQWERK